LLTTLIKCNITNIVFMGVLGEYSVWHVFRKQEFDGKAIRDLADVIFNIIKNGMFKI